MGQLAYFGANLTPFSLQCTINLECDPPDLITCLPACDQSVRGQSKQIILGGSDYSFDCGLAHGLLSWTAGTRSGKGGFLGEDAVLFGSALAGGFGGQFDLTVTQDLQTATDTVVRPDQDARIRGRRGQVLHLSIHRTAHHIKRVNRC